MTTYYSEGVFGVVSFETDPHHDINADAKFRSPDTERWVDCPSSAGIGPTYFAASISTPSPPTQSKRCRRIVATSWHEGLRPDRQALHAEAETVALEVTARCLTGQFENVPSSAPTSMTEWFAK